MQENGDVTDDSDETIVESSAFENDSDEDELHLKRLLFVCKEASFTSLTNSVCRASGRQSVLGHPSPEIQLMCRLSEKQDKMDQMDQISYDNKEYSEKSLSSSAASNMITSTAKVKEKSITTLEEMTSQNLFNEDDQNPEMIRSETTISLKDQSLGSRKLETGTSSEPSGMIPMRTSVGQALLHRNDGEINITDLLRPLDVSESPGVSSPLTDLFTPQSDVLSMYSSPNKKSCTLPSELVTALNALPRCALEPVSQMKMNALLENTAEQRTECLKSKANLFQIDEECTQIAEMALDPWFAEQQNEQLQELTESQLQDTLDEQLNIERLTFSNSISSGENQAKAGRSSPSKETREHSFITRKSARKRNQSKCSCCEMDSFKYGSVFSIQPEAKRRITQRNSRANDMSSDKDVKEKHAVAKPDKNKLTLSKKAFHSEDTCHKKGLQPKRCSAETGNETCQSLSLGIINRRNIFGETQLHKAAMEGDANHACTLIKAGANINVQDYAGWTALHEASAAGFYKIVKVLLEAGADVNCRGSGQITPIHDAAKEGYYEVAQLLLHYGADPLLQDENGKCALEQTNNKDMKYLLLSYIAKSRRSLITAKKSMRIQELNQAKRSNNNNTFDIDQQKLEANSKERFEHHCNCWPGASNEESENQEQTSREWRENSSTVHLSRKLKDNGLLCDYEKNDSRMVLSNVMQSTTDSIKCIDKKTRHTQKGQNEMISCTSVQAQKKRKVKTHNETSDLVQDKMNAIDAAISFKRITRSAMLHAFRAEKSFQETEKSPKTKMKETIAQKDQSHSIEHIVSEKKQIANEKNPLKLRNSAMSSESSVISLQSLHKNYATSPCKGHVVHSGSDAHLVMTLHELASLSVLSTVQHCKNYDDEHREESNSGKLKKPEKIINASLDGEENAFHADKKYIADEQLKHSKIRKNVNSDLVGFVSQQKYSATEDLHNEFNFNNTVIMPNLNERNSSSDPMGQNDNYNMSTGKNKENEQNIPESLTFVGDISLQENQLELAKLNTLEQKTANPSDSDCTIVLEEISESEESNICNMITSNLENCTEETPYANVWKHLPHGSSGIVAGPSVSENTEHCNSIIPFIHVEDESQVTDTLNENRDNSWICKTKEKNTCHNSLTVVQLQEIDPVKDKKSKTILHDKNKCTTNSVNANLCQQTRFQHTTEQEPPNKTEVQPSDSNRPVQDSSDSVQSTKVPFFSHGCSTREKYSKHQSISAILYDIEGKQEKLQLSELSTPRDADQYIQEMSQIQEVLNGVLVKQKAERDVLAKKYRSSVDSFKQGALREQLAKLASMQRSLLNVAQKQKELGQKIKAYENMKRIHARSSRDSTVLHNKNDYREDTNSDLMHNSAVVTVNMGFSFNPANVSCAETSFSAESTFSSQKHSQNQDNYLSNTKQRETDVRKEVSVNALECQPRLKPSENISQTATECQKILPTDQNSQSNINMKVSNQQCKMLSETVINSLSSHQKNVCSKNKLFLNDSSEYTEQFNVSHSESLLQRSEPHSSKQQQMDFTAEGKKKKIQLIDLIKLGKIKPGEDVLEFKLQDSGFKATLLWDGSIRTSSSKIFRSPVQWVKALLGEEISVSWKYVLNKVTYLGKQLSMYVSEETLTTQKPTLQSQQKQPEDVSRRPDFVPTSNHILQLSKIFLISNQEFLPCHIMDQHWKHYMDCDDLTFEKTMKYN